MPVFMLMIVTDWLIKQEFSLELNQFNHQPINSQYHITMMYVFLSFGYFIMP